ncbi:MAG: hypothetical protein U0638_12430 [Phycisphaerales bacterium]
MAERRTLKEGLAATPRIDPTTAREFVYGGKAPAGAANAGSDPGDDHSREQMPKPSGKSKTSARAKPVRRARLTTRIRADMAAALKRASLERQLQGVQPSAVQEILEEAIEPWLRTHGYLS